MFPPHQKTWICNGTSITWIAPLHCLLLVGYDDNNYIFNAPLKTNAPTYYSKESVELAYNGISKQAMVLVKDELTDFELLQFYGEIIKSFNIPITNTLAWGKPIVYETPNMKVTYQAKLNENFVPEPGFTNYVTMNVQGGSYSSSAIAAQNQLFDNVVTQMNGSIDKDNMAGISSGVATSVGDGKIAMAVGIAGETVKVDYMITKTIQISSNKTISINVKITFEFKDNKIKIPEPVKNNLPNTDEKDLYKAGVLGYVLVGTGIAAYYIIQLIVWAASGGKQPVVFA